MHMDMEKPPVQTATDIDFDLSTPPADPRIKEMEARIKWLESALTSVLQERRGDIEALAAGKAQRPALPKVDEDPGYSVDIDLGELASGETPLPELFKHPAAPLADKLRLTGAFSTLDATVREEFMAGKAAARDLSHPVRIDESLLDEVVKPKKAPEKIEVTADLEGFPRVIKALTTIWGTPECLSYLRKLIVDERGDRQGFPFHIMSDLMLLAAMLESQIERGQGWNHDHKMR